MTKRLKTVLLPTLALVSLLALAGCHRHKHADLDLSDSAEPDKILFDKSMEDIQNKRYDVARLTLQTLLNAYPDSEYLARAKLAIADSYFQEGTSGALVHAELEYKDFITFFPHAPETAFAQYRAALCSYRQLEKPDRDNTFALRAERELQTLLLDYPDSEYAKEGEKQLLQVQELLADGQFRVANFYYMRGSWRAAASRLADMVERYPNYSHRDHALWMLGRAFENKTPYYWNPDPERAAEYYAQLIREHPMSDYVKNAKEDLQRLGKPIPEPDPAILARAQHVEPVVTEAEAKRGLLKRMFGIVGGRPDMSNAAARLGPPPLHPPDVEPDIPPPPFTIAQRHVAMKVAEGLPEGSVLAEGQEVAEGADGEQTAQSTPPKEKKSFWRKIVPFM